MITFGTERPRRRPNLTPMIDVVFLLLVFFMLVSRFGMDRALPLSVAGGGGTYSGPPRLVDLAADGLRLNGVAIAPDALADALRGLTENPFDAIILRAGDGADLQALVAVMDRLTGAGFTRLVLVE
ncbi:MAG: biopolymer transporter ExbD [Pseudotabrizicola sp.]|uniref:ExbD/TolR family protein n=1 Tax=Pseudotabrizicola sp. TaxID=2939647 RepID=UPI0027265953|nr:biopolymer transporter ExbD [Pseudotabrizicola sp.]MDO8884535.1 biopolymer transporter ExbD [Pseudotabrizicola sp.]MDP2080475.1 biopolymer transporter ExbD [Pseudotabrizicola sp.]MDZ7573680.1 biopolymer transporter ExbD [Pseudotabrizicola sp.]